MSGSPKARQLRARPATSASYTPRDGYGVFCHGRARLLERGSPDFAVLHDHCVRTYGQSPDEWGANIAYIRIEAVGFLGMQAALELRLNVEDSPNSSGVVVDAIRVARIAADRGIGGLVEGVGSAFFKNPPDGVPESEAAGAVDGFLAGEAP